MISESGCHRIPAAEYLTDCCPAPSLSASLAHVLLSSSPWHAWTQHPRLNPAYQTEQSEAYDLGTAAHAYILEGTTGCVLVEASDWRTKAARDQRDAARLAGRVPILATRWSDVQAMATALRAQLASHEAPIPFTGGMPEPTLMWQEDDVWCRARLDWLHEDRRWVDDLKTTSGSAHPAAWTRSALYANGYDVQAALYRRGIKAVFGTEAEIRFVVQENFPPYALSVIGLGPEAMALAEKKVEHAIVVWRDCLQTGVWPGYPTRICWADLPPWEETRWLEREYQDREPAQRPAIVDNGRPIEEQLFGRLE